MLYYLNYVPEELKKKKNEISRNQNAVLQVKIRSSQTKNEYLIYMKLNLIQVRETVLVSVDLKSD